MTGKIPRSFNLLYKRTLQQHWVAEWVLILLFMNLFFGGKMHYIVQDKHTYNRAGRRSRQTEQARPFLSLQPRNPTPPSPLSKCVRKVMGKKKKIKYPNSPTAIEPPLSRFPGTASIMANCIAFVHISIRLYPNT
ncbi:hypothetical protein K432DRAFT_120662 [Lepidopterella palustris CBS 459.81]|uniref:Uncharacterized protein n=1 Tax=Lepidopterella palustris CBS 459.81 TaxID=1314670 RepID=A0A8E2JCW9_9PEZI|nr:hypothetical protein K432DRAFT_120662 [Lepidopterella palustris CBS 459.81]